MKKKFLVLVTVLSLAALPMLSYAHSGRTDSSGGHHDYENQSGLGSYHYHHGYGPHLHPNGVCPYGGDYDSAASGSYNSGSSSSGGSSKSTPPKKTIEITEKPDSPIKVGETITLGTDSYENVTWKSSNDKIATVNSDGEVKAVDAGSVTISATLNDGTSDSFTLEIDAIKIESLEPINWPSKITVYDSIELLVDIEPYEATDKSLEWKSSDTEIAIVSEKGEVSGIKTGYADITAWQGNISIHKLIQVVPEIESIEIRPDANKIELNRGDSVTLTAVVAPTNALVENLNWESDNTDVATVNSTGKVEAESSGTASIIVKSENGKSDVIIIEVTSIFMPIVFISIFLVACIAACVIGFKSRNRDII